MKKYMDNIIMGDFTVNQTGLEALIIYIYISNNRAIKMSHYYEITKIDEFV